MAEHAPTADSVAPADDALNRLSARFGDALQRDTRPGYEGLIAGPEQLVAVATALRANSVTIISPARHRPSITSARATTWK